MATTQNYFKSKSLKRPLATVTFSTFDELNGNKLVPGDKVIISYKRKPLEIEITEHGARTSVDIFNVMGLDAIRVANSAYGYTKGTRLTTDGTGFPIPNKGDYEAIARLCLVLYMFAKNSDTVTLRMPNRHFKTIDLSDLKK